MAWDAPGAFQYSYPAEVDLSDITASQFIAVAIGPSEEVAGIGQGNAVVKAYAAGQAFFGILQNLPKKGEAATILHRGYSRCIAGSAWEAGDKLSVGDKGYLQKSGGSDEVFAIAAESAVVGDCSTCFLK